MQYVLVTALPLLGRVAIAVLRYAMLGKSVSRLGLKTTFLADWVLRVRGGRSGSSIERGGGGSSGSLLNAPVQVPDLGDAPRPELEVIRQLITTDRLPVVAGFDRTPAIPGC
jgi:hypothetical protein